MGCWVLFTFDRVDLDFDVLDDDDDSSSFRCTDCNSSLAEDVSIFASFFCLGLEELLIFGFADGVDCLAFPNIAKAF